MTNGPRQPNIAYVSHIKWTASPEQPIFGREARFSPKPTMTPTRIFWLGYLVGCLCTLGPMVGVVLGRG